MILYSDPSASVRILLIIAFIALPSAVVLAVTDVLIRRRFAGAAVLVRHTSYLLIAISFVLMFGYAFLASVFGLR